ncbi:uncharacterized protein LOC123530911 isoform X2 [Mercenaria mercenaria]|uniref:uncharacterized protein LOC123530911 isoform X2 n=1 Tax=Mercenaria mercenaria TaxID=6596 RepID=UPI00234EBA76|nr:uncharacterized protein LOC123530911 isoform X2 [Mercenaria mercenaria]
MDRQNNSEKSRDGSEELKDKQTADNVAESVDTTKECPIRRAAEYTRNGVHYEAEKSRDGSEELKDKQTADNVAESVDTTKECPIRRAAEYTRNGVHYEAEKSRDGSEELKDKQTADNVAKSVHTTKECPIRRAAEYTRNGVHYEAEKSRDGSEELKDKQTADNVAESVDTTKECPIRRAAEYTRNGVHYEAEKNRDECEELKDKQTADNVAESVDTTKECPVRRAAEYTRNGVHYEAEESSELKAAQIREKLSKSVDTSKEDQTTDDTKNEEYTLNILEQRFKDDVQNHWDKIELLSQALQKTLNTGDSLLKKGRPVGNDLNQLKRIREMFCSNDAFSRCANTSNKCDFPDPKIYSTSSGKPDHFGSPKENLNESKELEDTRIANNATGRDDTDKWTAFQSGIDLRCDKIEPSVNSNVMQTSRENSSQSVTELIEDMFGTQSGVRKVVHSGYICIYNLEKRLGITYEYLTKDNLLGDAHRKGSFKRDEDVGISCPTCKEFRTNNYHIGHLAASANYKNSQDQTNDTFYLTNAVPQKTKGSTWEKIEIYARDLLEKHKNESLLVITGWLMIEKPSENGQAAIVTYQKHNKLSVPTHLFKILITVNEKKPDGKAVFIVPNNPNEESCFDDRGAHQKLVEIENIHGYKFVPKIDTSTLRDLSNHFKNNVISDIDFKMLISEKKVRDAKSMERLEKVMASLNGLEPSESLKNLYQSRKRDFQKQLS